MPVAEPLAPGDDLGAPLDAVVLSCAGCVLGVASVYAGTGWLDGFHTGGTEVVGRKLVKLSLWLLPSAAVLGVLLHRFYAAVLRPGQAESKPGVMLLAIPRAFFHFPLYGMLALLGIIVGGAWLGVVWLKRRLLGGPPERVDDGPNLPQRLMGIPIWFIMLPFIAAGAPMEGDMSLPKTVPQRALLRWLPFILLGIAFWTGAVSEDSGERVDPYWLATAASAWIGEFLFVAVRVMPALRGRRGLPV
ncbi:MAG: hypothetical protein SF051_15225 [Elusimicrobiota bacterium]|nr:hypothetical protein [Elusimicrobiota bacterium]